MCLKNKRVLILQGGGFKTSFSAGVLDSFAFSNFDGFDSFIGVSAGSVALSYFLSKQPGVYIELMKKFKEDPQSRSIFKFFSKGYFNIDLYEKLATEHEPFDIKSAKKRSDKKDFFMVLTNAITGKASYLKPSLNNWLDLMIASSTLPFLTKGKHFFDNHYYCDGGISDPLPIKWAIENGASKVLVVRTTSLNYKPKFFNIEDHVHRLIIDRPHFKKALKELSSKFNDAIDFLNSSSHDNLIYQIAPIKTLETGLVFASIDKIVNDYRYGLEMGLKYLNSIR